MWLRWVPPEEQVEILIVIDQSKVDAMRELAEMKAVADPNYDPDHDPNVVNRRPWVKVKRDPPGVYIPMQEQLGYTLPEFVVRPTP